MLNCFAAALTVDLFSIMYSASSQARSSIFVYTCTTPKTHIVHVYDRPSELMIRLKLNIRIHRRKNVHNDEKTTLANKVTR